MHDAKLVEIIVTTNHLRGTGADDASPFRIVTQYWSKDGTLLAEVDPCAAVLPPERLRILDSKLFSARDAATIEDRPLSALLGTGDFMGYGGSSL